MYLATVKATALSVHKLQQINDRPSGVISPAKLFKSNVLSALKDLEVELIENPNYETTAISSS